MPLTSEQTARAMDALQRAAGELTRRLDNAIERFEKIYIEHKTLLDDFAALRGRNRDLLAILQRMYPPDSTIGLSVKRLINVANAREPIEIVEADRPE